MKITIAGENMFTVEDFRGKLTVVNDEIVELLDKQGVWHYPMDTPDDLIVDGNRFDLDKRTGFVAHIRFGAHYCTHTAYEIYNQNFKQINHTNYFTYTDCGFYDYLKPEYSLTTGKTLKELLVTVIQSLYRVGLYDGFKIMKGEFFHRGCSWRKLTFSDIMEVWNTYNDRLTPDEFKCCHENGCAKLKLDHPLREFITPNFQVYSINGFNPGECANIVVYQDALESFDGLYSNLNDRLTKMFYSAPVFGMLLVAGEQYSVSEYLFDEYEWDVDKFLLAFFEKESFNRSMQSLITECVQQHGELNYV